MTGVVRRAVVIVLAAGSGTRLGLGPKAHVDLAGQTFLARILGACRSAGLEDIYIVGSAQDAKMPLVERPPSVRLVLNPDPSRGMSSSVQLGLAAALADDGVGGALIFPADFPVVRPDTLHRLVDAAFREPTAWIRPVHEGVSGHPVALGALVVPRVVTHAIMTPLREVLRLDGAPGVDMPCDDHGILDDVDTPDDLARLRASLRPFG